MKLGVVIYSGDAETIWNAFRVANFSLAMGDQVSVFLIGQGVTFEFIGTVRFDASGQAREMLHSGGKLLACGTCLEIHGIKPAEIYRVATLKEIYDIVRESDKVLTF